MPLRSGWWCQRADRPLALGLTSLRRLRLRAYTLAVRAYVSTGTRILRYPGPNAIAASMPSWLRRLPFLDPPAAEAQP
jgi:hypothetical protein